MDSNTRWFRRLLKLLPADFQADYARDMERTFAAQHRDASRRGGMRGVAALWWETLRDLLRTAPREHLEQLAQDATYAARSLRSRPGATVAAIATLAIGIGSVTAILSIVNGVDWRPLGYPNPDRVVLVRERVKGVTSPTTGFSTFADWRDRAQSFDALAAMGSTEATLSAGGEAERVAGLRVTPEYFAVTRMAPALGRAFTAAENRQDNRRFIILSARVWRRLFGADPQIVGRAVHLNGFPYVVTGVMQDAAEDVIADQMFDKADVWLPLAYEPSLPFACRTCRHIRVAGRLRDGVSPDQAQAEVDVITRQLAREHPAAYAGAGAVVTRVADVLLGPVRPALYLLLAAAGVLLLIAAVNVANLLLVRAVERGPEIATRRALGVASGRLVRQLLTESLVLAAAGAACGVALAVATLRGLVNAAPSDLPRIAGVALDARVLAMTAGLTAMVGVLFGTLPAWHLASADLALLLRGTRTLVSGGRRAGRLLVGANVALAVILLAVTGLLGRSFVALLRVDPGFDPRAVVVASLSPAGPAYAADGASYAFFRRFLDRLARPGDVVALTTQLPTRVNDGAGLHIEGRNVSNPEESPSADRFAVTADYFRALHIPIVRGRGFTPHDVAGSPEVAILNQTAATELFPGEDPIGRRIMLGGADGPRRVIVGIAGDVRHHGLAERVEYQAYIPLEQFGERAVDVVVRSGNPPAEVAARIRAAVAALDRTQVAHDIRPYEAVVGETLAERRFLLWLIAAFAGAALLLAVVGLYGVVSYVVAQRGRDIGLRVALGAGAADIRRLVLGIGLTPVAIGIAVGLALTPLVTRPIESMLFSVQRLDPATVAGAGAVLFACAVAACYLPARRATRVDPIAALRAE